jgi:RNA polymerase sigma-70 factor (ECF subfamily)
MPADHAILLVARYLEGETVADIARRERSTEVAVRSRLARARQAFRAAFAPFGADAPAPSTEAPHESS